MVTSTALVLVTTNAADTRVAAAWLRAQIPDDVAVAVGFYAGVSALDRGARAVVVDVATPAGRDDWRLAELRGRSGGATVVVIADATGISALAAALGADLAVTSVRSLPPLRELMVTAAPALDDQANLRRTTR